MHARMNATRAVVPLALLALFGAAACKGREAAGEERRSSGSSGSSGTTGGSRRTASGGEVALAASDTNPLTALTRMGDYLRDLKTFRVDVDGVKEEPLKDGQNLQFAGTVRYTVQRPSGLRAELRTDRKQRDYVFNGKTLTVYAPRMKYYATVAAPPTIREMLDTAVRRYDLEFPVADLFLWGTDRAAVDSIKASAYVGPAKVAGRDCDHFAFRQSEVDWQLWIERGDRPLPCKLVITSITLPTRPEYSAVLTWDLSPKIEASAFNFVPPKDAHAIKLQDFSEPTATVAKKN
jgi:hypothetical protein